MEYGYNIDEEQARRSFWFGWYHRPGLGLLRRLGGPVLILLGVWYTLSVTSRDFASTALAGFLVLYGLLMILRPYILLGRMRLTARSQRVLVTDGRLSVRDDTGEYIIEAGNILSVTRKSHYLILKVRVQVVQYLLFDLDCLSEDPAGFEEAVRALQAPPSRS